MSVLAAILIFTLFLLGVRFAELKISADLEARIGPQLAGFSGVLQPFMDWHRLWFKTASKVGRTEPRLWWALHWVLLVGATSLAPGIEQWWTPRQEFSIFGCFCLVLLSQLAWLGVGLRQESIERWLGVTRRTAMVWTAAGVLLLCILWVNIEAHGLAWSDVSSKGVLILRHPLALLIAIPSFLSVMMLAAISPFSASSSTEISGGDRSGLVGVQLLRADVASLWGKMIWGMWLGGVFLGGNDLPKGLVAWSEAHDAPSLPPLIALTWALLRSGLILIAMTVLGRVSASLRADQATDLAWKWLFPCGLLGVALTLLLRWVPL